MLLKLWAKALTSDRGEGPVPYIVLVAAMAGVAIVLAGLLSGVGQRIIGTIVGP